MDLLKFSKRSFSKEDEAKFLEELRNTLRSSSKTGKGKFNINKKDSKKNTILDNLFSGFASYEVYKSVMCYPGIKIDYDKIAYKFATVENPLISRIFIEYIQSPHVEKLGINKFYNLNFHEDKNEHVTATLLMVLCMNADHNKESELCKMLLEKGADPNIRNNKGLRALDYAVLNSSGVVPTLAKSVNETDYIKRADNPFIMKKLLLNLDINLLTKEDFDYAYKKFPEIKKSVEEKLSSKKKIQVLKKHDPYGVLSNIHTDFHDYLLHKLDENNKDLLLIYSEPWQMEILKNDVIIFTVDDLFHALKFGYARFYTPEQIDLMRNFIISTNNNTYKKKWNELIEKNYGLLPPI